MRWRLKSPASGSFTQPFIQVQIEKKTSKLRVIGLCVGNSPVTGEFHTQMARNVENVSIWWHHHVYYALCLSVLITLQLPVCSDTAIISCTFSLVMPQENGLCLEPQYTNYFWLTLPATPNDITNTYMYDDC